jgi:hypothetical protein
LVDNQIAILPKYFKPNANQNGFKNQNILFSNVNPNELYFPILVSGQQFVKIVSP